MLDALNGLASAVPVFVEKMAAGDVVGIEKATFVCVPAEELSVIEDEDDTEAITYGTELIVIVSPAQPEFALKRVPDTHVTAVPDVDTTPTGPPV